MSLAWRDAVSGEQMTLDAPDKDVARIVFAEDLEMRVEAVAVHFHVQAGPPALRTNLYLSALDSRSYGKNCVVRDQSVPFLVIACLPLGLKEVCITSSSRMRIAVLAI